MRSEKIWADQCRATKAIRRRFGAKGALDDLIGEKLINAVEAERERVRRKRMAEPLTERGRETKRRLDLPTSLIRKQERRVDQAVLKREDVPNNPKKRH